VETVLQKAQHIRSALREGDRLQEISEILDEDKELLQLDTPFGSWLHVAASFGRVDSVKWLLDRGLPINRRGGTYGGNALNLAASKGHLDVVRLLLDRGSEMDVSEPERNPLFAAILDGHCEVVTELLTRGIDPYIKYSGDSMKDMDAFAFARENGQLEALKTLEAYCGRHD
jgi:ankyrin repeat protein